MSPRLEGLIEALDQYVENQAEHEADNETESPKLQAARAMLDEIHVQMLEALGL